MSNTLLKINWEKYLRDIRTMTEIVKKCHFNTTHNFERVIGVSRGGLIPATIISHELDLPLICHDPKNSELDLRKLRDTDLVVDDLLDTGETLKHCEGSVVVIYRKEECPIHPRFIPAATYPQDWWIQFPYETDEETADYLKVEF